MAYVLKANFKPNKKHYPVMYSGLFYHCWHCETCEWTQGVLF